MSKTIAEIRDRAANDLGLLPLNQPLAAQHVTRIEDAYAEVYDELKSDSLAFWSVAGDVPDKYAPYVIAMVAFNCMSTYGTSAETYQRIVNITGPDGELAKQRIRNISTRAYVTQDEITDY